MRKFDTKVQYLKYKVLREVARQAWNDTLLDNVMSIPRELAPRNAETISCCVYKERAILRERVRLSLIHIFLIPAAAIHTGAVYQRIPLQQFLRNR